MFSPNAHTFDSLKYPVGHFTPPPSFNSSDILHWIGSITSFPEKLKMETASLEEKELNYRYRPEGWTIQQVIHHCADSHMNAFIRFKLALTESEPVIKPYFEARWAVLPDTLDAPPEYSRLILDGLHHRWGRLLMGLDDNDLNKSYYHPEHNKLILLKEAVALYSWHCEHHLAHVKQAKRFKNNFPALEQA